MRAVFANLQRGWGRGGGIVWRHAWSLRIAAVIALDLTAVVLLSLDEANREPSSLAILAGAAALAVGIVFAFEGDRPKVGRSAGLGAAAAALGFVSVRLLGPGFATVAALAAPLVVLAGASIGPVGAFATAELLILGWAISLGLASGGLWPADALLALGPVASLSEMVWLALVANGVAFISSWGFRQTDAEAARELRVVREERDGMARELAGTEPLAAAGRLVANVAHEISNPVQAMDHMLFVLLEETPEEDTRRSRLITVKQAVDRLAQYLEQLSSFYRPSGRTGSTDLNRVLGDVFRFLDRQLANANVKVSQRLEPELPAASIEEEALRQVVLNVVLNAVEAMADGGELEVTTGEEDGSVCAIFQDSGAGVPDADLERIFEPFFTTKREQGGSGLGLSISRRIVRRHGGDLVAKSAAGRTAGARFVLRVPAASGGVGRASP